METTCNLFFFFKLITKFFAIFPRFFSTKRKIDSNNFFFSNRIIAASLDYTQIYFLCGEIMISVGTWRIEERLHIFRCSPRLPALRWRVQELREFVQTGIYHRITSSLDSLIRSWFLKRDEFELTRYPTERNRMIQRIENVTS